MNYSVSKLATVCLHVQSNVMKIPLKLVVCCVLTNAVQF